MKELIIIQNKLKAPKNQVNKFGGFNYRSCEDILEAVKPLLLAQNCFLTLSDNIVVKGSYTKTTDTGMTTTVNRVYIEATATLTNSGGKVVTVKALAREPIAQKGMNEAQITGSASSYARKYALNGLFAIDDNKETDAENNAPAKPKNVFKKSASTTISQNQITKLFTVGSSAGLSVEQIRPIVENKGYKSTKNILIKDYDAIIKDIKETGKTLKEFKGGNNA